MTQNASPSQTGPMARPPLLKRAALFASGAATGMVVSVAASYTLVSLFVPRPAPNAAHVAKPDPTPTGDTLIARVPVAHVLPVPTPVEGPELATLSVLPVPSPINGPERAVIAPIPTAVTPVAPTLPDADSAMREFAATPVLADPAAVVRTPTATPEAVTRIETPTDTPALTPETPAAAPVIALTYGRPDVVPPARPETLARQALLTETALPGRALSGAPGRPDSMTGPSPAAFAALADSDATGRTGATIGFGAPQTRPAPRPVTEQAAMPDAIIAAAAPAATTLPRAPATRPAPRPDIILATMTAPAAAVIDTPTAIPGIRPEPRPEVLRVAARIATEDTPSAAGSLPRRTGNDNCGRTLAHDMPNRRGGADTGAEFFAGLSNAGGSERDRRIINELARGNMPGFLRDLHPVTFAGQDSRGRATEIVICVTPDYLALGSDRDFVRVPLGLPAAARIAGTFDMTLPTPRMVDAIYAQAQVRLSPAPMTPGPQMSSTKYFVRHNATIEGQRGGARGLISGHKKDVVMASRMASAPGRVAIYGWHRTSGNPIQPVSTVHGASYADYSHGIRLVSNTAFLDGKAVALDDLLASSRYAYLINKEGPMPGSVIRIASR